MSRCLTALFLKKTVSCRCRYPATREEFSIIISRALSPRISRLLIRYNRCNWIRGSSLQRNLISVSSRSTRRGMSLPACEECRCCSQNASLLFASKYRPTSTIRLPTVHASCECSERKPTLRTFGELIVSNFERPESGRPTTFFFVLSKCIGLIPALIDRASI